MAQGRRHACRCERVCLAMLLIEIAPFGNGKPGLGSRQYLLAGRIAGGGYDKVRRSDIVIGIIDPASMFDIARFGCMPVPLHLSDRDPSGGWACARADPKGSLAEAFTTATGKNEDKLLVWIDAYSLAGDLPLRHAQIDPQPTGEERLRPHRVVPFGLGEVGMKGRQQPCRPVIGGAMSRIAAITMLEDFDMRDRADAGKLCDFSGHVADEESGVAPMKPGRHLMHGGADARPS